jgi:hypothetical protein
MSRTQTAPFTKAASVSKSDSTVLAAGVRGIYVGGAGDVAVLLAGDASPVTFKAVPVGTILPVAATKVMDANTTASLMLALF